MHTCFPSISQSEISLILKTSFTSNYMYLIHNEHNSHNNNVPTVQ